MDALGLYLLTGAGAGLLAGLFGIGGGLIIVPALLVVFQEHGVAAQHSIKVAIGTSLATIVVTAAASVASHHRRGAVQWSVVARLVPGIVVGTLAGAAVADRLPDAALRTGFALFVFLVAAQMALDLRARPGRALPGATGMTGAGAAIGFVSALVGIGGGTLTTPFLVWCGTALPKAIATSAACGFPIAVAGAAGYLLAGLNEAGLPAASTGYLYWPAFFGVGVASVLCAPLGARLTHRLPVGLLKRLFALLLLAAGARLIAW